MHLQPACHGLPESRAAVGDKGAAPLVDADEPERLERADRLADAHAADAESLHELALRREAIARGEVAGPDRALDLEPYFFAALGPLDRRQRAAACFFLSVGDCHQ